MYNYFAALIYVTDTESEAIMRMYDWKSRRYKGDDQLYYEAVTQVGGEKRRIIAARQDEMGMTAAATLSMKLIQHARPKYLIMPGIAAGVKDEDSNVQMYGDVILADRVWNYSNGKYVSPDVAEIVFGEVGFVSRPTMIMTDEKLMPLLEKAVECAENECHVHIGPLASGSAVVANKSILDKQITGKYSNTQGLEMEAYGVIYAATHATEPKPSAIIAKSICDFADSRKSDVYQKFAAYTSCEFVRFLIDKILE